jgi:hypothetical protein
VGLATLTVVAASAGVALAVNTNSIKVSTPFLPTLKGNEATIKVSGEAIYPLPGDQYPAIDLFTGPEPCKDTLDAELTLFERRPGTVKLRLGHVRVKDKYKEEYRATEGTKGKYYACAYLYVLPQGTELAHAADSWRVL